MIDYTARAQRIAAAFADLKPRWPWLGGDLQTLRNTLSGASCDLSSWPSQIINIRFSDNGDQSHIHVHRGEAEKPMLALIHGLGGDADSIPIRYLARHFLLLGWTVARVNLRASKPVIAGSKKLSHSGKTEDLRDILKQLRAERPIGALHALGISLGGNMLGKALGTDALAGLEIASAMTICAPIDLAATQRRVMEGRNWVYHRHLLNDLQQGTYGAGVPETLKVAARAARTVYEYDDQVIAVLHGFASADDYYEKASAMHSLDGITVPTLLLTAEDDPWIPATSYRAAKSDLPENAHIVISATGGHVGYHFRGLDLPAYCMAAEKWFATETS